MDNTEASECSLEGNESKSEYNETEEELQTYCVYLITNSVNGKQYAGQTCRAVKERWREHQYAIKGKQDYWFLRALRKYGPESFVVCTLREGLTKDQANEEERLVIRTLNLLDKRFGYNMTEGGDGPLISVHIPREAKDKYLSGISAKELSEQYGCDPGTILRNLKSWGVKTRSVSEALKKSGRRISQSSAIKRRDIPDYLISRLYLEGWNSYQLADFFRLDPSTIRYRLEKLGIDRRKGVNQHSGRTRQFESESQRIAYIQQIRSEIEEGR